jgi:hypothetical protein
MEKLVFRIPLFSLALLAGSATSAFAIDAAATPAVDTTITARNNLETNLTSALSTSTTQLSTSVNHTITCAQNNQLYNQSTNTCIGPGGASSGDTPSDVTGPFVQSFYSTGTFNVPANYSTMLVYLYSGGAGGGAQTGMMFGTYTCGNSGGTTSFGGFWAAGGGSGCGGSAAQSGRESMLFPLISGGGAGGMAFGANLGGGNGGYAFKKWSFGDAGAPTPGVPLTVTVGGGGAGVLSYYYQNYGGAYAAYNGQPGGAGHAVVYWMQSQ